MQAQQDGIGDTQGPGAAPPDGGVSLRREAVAMALGRMPDDRLQRFISEPDPVRALREWFGDDISHIDPAALAGAIDRDIAFIDGMLTDQLNAVLHHPRFQALEASWRGLAYLCRCAAPTTAVVVKALNVTWNELARDFGHASDFDQSQLFHKVYSQEFGMPGGQPFGVLLCDYEVRHRPSAAHPVDDVATLGGLASVAAAAFAPAVLSASPHLLGIDSFTELDRLRGLGRLFRGDEYRRYERLRQEADSRFLALVLPRILMREPHGEDGAANVPFRYRENRAGLTHEQMCWGSAVYAFGEVLIRAFDLHGWFADICGAREDEIDHGLVVGVPAPDVEPDSANVVNRSGCEIVIPPHVEYDLWQLGLMNLNACKDTPYLVFRSGASIQSVPHSGNSALAINARLSAMLRYILCVSRFAHYAKVQVRDRIGSYVNAQDCQQDLQRWLHSYCIGNDDASPEMKARYPLREASVDVKELPGRPGSFACVMQLRPHFQLDQIFTTFKLTTDVAIAGAGR